MTTALAIRDTETQEPLSERKAQALDKRIRTACEKINLSREALMDLLDQAAAGQIHVALNYTSWTAWFAEAVSLPTIDVSERKELAKMLTSKGLSQRAAAKALGCSQKTIDRDTEGAPESEDSTVTTGLDGKTYNRIKAEVIDVEYIEQPEEPEESEEPEDDIPERTKADVTDEFRDETETLAINVQAFKDLISDELFPDARKLIEARYGKRVENLIIDLNKIRDEMSWE